MVDDGAPDRKALPPPHLFDLWIAVLSARAIPYQLAGRGNRLRLYVPALYEGLARNELAEVRAESAKPVLPQERTPAHDNAHWVLLLLLALIVWHGVRMGWGFLPLLGTPELSPEEWLQKGAADVFRIRTGHEWYRCVTTLTLHSDSRHLFGNVLFGAPFLILLCRRAGLGAGLLMVVLAGTLGNVFNALYRPPDHVSVGFSTALFGAVGALSGFLALQGLGRDALSWRRGIVLLTAGAGILAMLGTEGETTDYAAHLFGLLAGFMVGGVFAPLLRRTSFLLETLLGTAALALLVVCWRLALSL